MTSLTHCKNAACKEAVSFSIIHCIARDTEHKYMHLSTQSYHLCRVSQHLPILIVVQLLILNVQTRKKNALEILGIYRQLLGLFV